MADVFRAQGLKLQLLTSGLFLERDAEQVAARFEEVTLSLDGHNRDLYRQIRGVDGLEVIERGVRKLKACAPQLPVRARSTLHRHNFHELPHLIDKARALGLAQISFLAADVTSEAFGRRSETSTRGLLLTEERGRGVCARRRRNASLPRARFRVEVRGRIARKAETLAALLCGTVGTWPVPAGCVQCAVGERSGRGGWSSATVLLSSGRGQHPPKAAVPDFAARDARLSCEPGCIRQCHLRQVCLFAQVGHEDSSYGRGAGRRSKVRGWMEVGALDLSGGATAAATALARRPKAAHPASGRHSDHCTARRL